MFALGVSRHCGSSRVSDGVPVIGLLSDLFNFTSKDYTRTDQKKLCTHCKIHFFDMFECRSLEAKLNRLDNIPATGTPSFHMSGRNTKPRDTQNLQVGM